MADLPPRPTSKSVMDSLGAEIVAIISPVSVCMLLVVLLVHGLTPKGADNNSIELRSLTLVYHEQSSDSDLQKFEGAVMNAAVFIVAIAVVTFGLVGLFYIRCTRLIWGYMAFSAFTILSWLGGALAVQIIQMWSIPIDAVTFAVVLYNFSVIGVMAVFFCRMPIFLTQSYLVFIGAVVAFWFTHLPEWTTWLLLVAMALYDIVAVLVPGGPLRLLVELAMERNEEIPALIYEARPTSLSSSSSSAPSSSATTNATTNPSRNRVRGRFDAPSSFSDRLQDSPLTHRAAAEGRNRGSSAAADVAEVVELEPGAASSLSRSATAGQQQQGREANSGRVEASESGASTRTNAQAGASSPSSFGPSRRQEGEGYSEWADSVENEELQPLVGTGEEEIGGTSASFASARGENSTMAGDLPATANNLAAAAQGQEGRGEGANILPSNHEQARGQQQQQQQQQQQLVPGFPDSIKLGLGDFIFYSVLVGRAAMYDMMAVCVCYLAIIAGLGATLLLLAVYRRALPALPISITLGVLFYILTRIALDPIVVALSSHLLFF